MLKDDFERVINGTPDIEHIAIAIEDHDWQGSIDDWNEFIAEIKANKKQRIVNR